MGMGDRGESGVYGNGTNRSGMYGQIQRVAGFSLHNDQPFFLNLPPLLYIIVIM